MAATRPRRWRTHIPATLVDLADPATVVALRQQRGPAIAPATAIAQFVEAKRAQPGSSQRTVGNYRQFLFLGYLCAFLERERGIRNVWAVTADDLEAWLITLRHQPSARTSRPLSPYTVAAYGRHMLACWRWLEARGIVPPHTTRSLHEPRVPKNQRVQPQTFTDDEVRALFVACGEDSNGPAERLALTQRNQALVAVLLETGVRREELVTMDVEGIDWQHLALRVRKSKTELRDVGMGHNTAARLRRYVHNARPWFVEVSVDPDIALDLGPLWLNRDGFLLSDKGVKMLFVRLKRRTGMSGQCSPLYVPGAM
jgi:site-specific recombinase XerD